MNILKIFFSLKGKIAMIETMWLQVFAEHKKQIRSDQSNILNIRHNLTKLFKRKIEALRRNRALLFLCQKLYRTK